MRRKHTEEKYQMEIFEKPEFKTKDLHKIFSSENVLIIHKGNFSQEAIRPMLIMVQDNVKNKDLAEQRKIFHLILLEILILLMKDLGNQS